MKITKVLVAMLMVTTGLISLLTIFPATSGLPPVTGNWVINGPETVTGGSYNVTNGNVIIQRGGTLTLDGATIIMNDTSGSGGAQYNVEVQNGGTLIMKNNALIRVAQNNSNYYYFYFRLGSKATITNSNISDVGAPTWANWQQQGIFIQSSDVTIDKTDITRGNLGIIISDCSPKITNNTIFRNDGYGIDNDGGAPYIYKNTIINNGQGPPNWQAWHAISIYNSKATMANNDIRSNGWHAAWETHGWGIWATVSNVTITNNTIQANGGGGIGLQNHVSGLVADNTLTDNDDIGIYVSDMSNPTVMDNNVRVSNNHGMVIDGISTPFVKGNTFNVTGDDGIYSYDASSPTLEGNDVVVWGNGVGIYLNDNGAPVLRQNTVFTETGNGIIFANWAEGTMEGGEVNSQNDALDVWDFATLTATDLKLTSRNARGISSSWYTELNVRGATINSQREGVRIQNDMTATLADLTITTIADNGVEAWTRSVLDIDNATIVSQNNEGLIVTDSVVDIVNSSITANGGPDIHLGSSNLVTPGLVRALNTTFNETDSAFDNDNSRLNVSWYAQRIWAEWQNTRRVPGANLIITNIHDNDVFNGTLDMDGEIEWLPVQEYTQNRTLRDDYTRHNFSASMNGVSGFSGATVNKNVNIRIILQDLVNDPDLTIVYPVEDGIYNTSLIQVNGTAFDPESGIYQVTVAPLGKAQQVAKGQEDWHEWVNLTDGEWTLQVNATNYAGVITRDTVKIMVDTVPPMLTVDYPNVTELVNTTELNVTGTTEIGAIVTVNGLPANVDASGNFWRNITLPEGVNTVTVASHDKALNFNFSKPTVTVDITPPPLTVFTPVEGLITPEGTIIATGSVEVGATLTVNGIGIAHIGEPFSVSVPLKEGINRLLFLAMDPAGNRNITVRNVIYDPTAPDVTVMTPPGATLTNVSSINISGMAKDLTLAMVTVNGVEVTPDAAGNYSLIVALQEGLNEIEVIGYDMAGHATIVRRLVTLDTIAPPLQVFSPVDNYLTNQPTLHVIGTTEVGAKVMVDTFNATVGTDGKFDYTYTLKEGLNTISVVANDPAGNPTIETRAVTLDTQPPTLTVSSPKKGLSVNEVELDVKGTVTDNIAVAKLTVNGKEVKVNNGKFSTNLALKKGATKLIIQATDTAGNVATQEVKVSRGGLTMAETGLLIVAIVLMVVGLIIGMMLAKKRMKPVQDTPMDDAPQTSGSSRFKDDMDEDSTPEAPDDDEPPVQAPVKKDKPDRDINEPSGKPADKVSPGPPKDAPKPASTEAPKKPEGQLAEGEMHPQDQGKSNPAPKTEQKADIDGILEKLKK